MLEKKYKNSWELRSGLFEIHWVNGVAAEVAVEGKIFKATRKKILRTNIDALIKRGKK